MDGEDRAQVLLRLALPVLKAVIGLILAVGLDHAELQVPAHDGVDVEHRPGGGFDRDPQVVFLPLFIDNLGNRPTGGVIDAGHPAGADGHVGGFCRQCGCGQDGRESQGKAQGQDFFPFHRLLLFIVLPLKPCRTVQGEGPSGR